MQTYELQITNEQRSTQKVVDTLEKDATAVCDTTSPDSVGHG